MARLLSLVSFKIFPAHMGGQKGVALFYEYLKPYHEIFMAVSNDHWEGTTESYLTKALLYPNKRMLRNLFQLPALVRWIKTEKMDCIVAEHSYTAWLAFLLKLITGRPFLIHSHNMEAQRFRQMGRSWWKAYWRYEKWIHQQADHSFFISEEDKQLALSCFKLSNEKCTVVPYGIEEYLPYPDARRELAEALQLKGTYLFHFNGTMDYEPNIEAVEGLLYQLYPLLQKEAISFDLLITGKRLPAYLRREIARLENVHYIEFAEDINHIYQACDLFLNTVNNNSGVKTKVIEAIGNQCKVISFQSGANGIPAELCGLYLSQVEDDNWTSFLDSVLSSLNKPPAAVPESFYKYFAWKYSIETAVAVIARVSESWRKN
ncbi:MAG TPA: glycosyltransferase [Flavisolibacter sp.]|jgi:hypothetical protein|nr:glycosyltransferase [Flavisolibacter sp.]